MQIFTNIGRLISLDQESWGGGPLAPVADALLAVDGGRVVWLGRRADCPAELAPGPNRPAVDLAGRLVMPGLVDCHTHLVFAGERQDEFAEKLRGVGYLEIAARGGGIMGTVRATRAAGDEELLKLGLARLDRALALGVTTIEIKSGYGLSAEHELRLLRIIRELARRHPVRVVPTLLAAHELPPDRPRGDYLREIVEVIIPAAARERLAVFCDVFCEQNVYSPDEAERVLRAGLAHGLRPKIHAEQITASGGCRVAARVGAVSADHLEQAGPAEITALARAGVTAVLLPGCAFFMGLADRAPARALIEAGVPVALATNFNPGSSMTQNIQLIATMGCTMLRLTIEEALAGVTRLAARALGLEGECGRLRAGAAADWVVSSAPDPESLVYEFGRNQVDEVYIAGKRVV